MKISLPKSLSTMVSSGELISTSMAFFSASLRLISRFELLPFARSSGLRISASGVGMSLIPEIVDLPSRISFFLNLPDPSTSSALAGFFALNFPDFVSFLIFSSMKCRIVTGLGKSAGRINVVFVDGIVDVVVVEGVVVVVDSEGWR